MHKLIVTGSGIKSVAHITEETKKVIQGADKVLYLVHEDTLKEWILREAQEAESLEPIYFSSNKRVDAYHKITAYIISEYKKVACLCIVFYGHPTVFADSALQAVKQIKADGGDAVILPAISSMDCLFSDLEIDPGDQGSFSIDATELLIYEKPLDTSTHVILWQGANLGTHDLNQTKKLHVLSDYLNHYYADEHPVCIYEAAVYPSKKPRIDWTTVNELSKTKINASSTLYIPPVNRGELSHKYLSLLEMDFGDFKLST
ncbi:MAG: methylase [Legionellales bacterium RIFCSPHIGHO2_12_FULL_35_11]|nr:MAG: methylase [Legionellales bacterium RIFCSPHIGHO2_12_FULL_35_11]